MEFLYSDIKKMDVISMADGRHLGRVCDAAFSFPEGRLCGFYVTGGKGFSFARQDMFVPLSAIVRIGEDVIITDVRELPPPKERCRKPRKGACPPAEPCSAPKDRRSYDEYE